MVYFLVASKRVVVKYVKNEYSWAEWNGRYWRTRNDNDILDTLYEATKKINYGGIENRAFNRSITYPLRALCNIEEWPSALDILGHCYKNGVLYPKDDKLIFGSHHPDFMHRHMFEVDYIEQGGLNLAVHGLISDIAFGKTHAIHVF